MKLKKLLTKYSSKNHQNQKQKMLRVLLEHKIMELKSFLTKNSSKKAKIKRM
jgi:hypothetical protein